MKVITIQLDILAKYIYIIENSVTRLLFLLTICYTNLILRIYANYF